MRIKELASGTLLAATLLFTTHAAAESIAILGGGLKGGPYAMAVGLSKLLKDKANIDAAPQTSGGMVAQARILAKGNAQFAFGLGGAIGAWAYKGERRFEAEGAKENLRAVFAYPFGTFQWVTLADSGINTLRDLKGKKVSVGKASSTTQTFARIFLPAHGIEMSDVTESTPGFGGGFNQLRDGNVDAHLSLGKTPISPLREMATTKQFRLVDMDPAVVKKLVADIGSGVSHATIDTGAYGDNQKNNAAVNTMAIYFGFSTSTNTSAEVVYQVTKTLFDNLDAYKKANPKAKSVDLQSACEGLAFPLHEGAKRYYKEIGLKACE
jgi:TRAP transporter TAXI family solute receptor